MLTKKGWATLLSITNALLLTTGCSIPGVASEPPWPTIVASTATSEPTATTIVQETISSPTVEPIPTEIPKTVVTEVKKVTPPPNTEVTATATQVIPATDIPPTITPLPPPPQPQALEALKLVLNPVVDGFTRPVYLTHAGDSSGRLFVAEQAGQILIVQDNQIKPDPFLDIVAIVGSDANEQGLLSVAFHPKYIDNGLFFVNYTNKQGDTVIARYQRADNPDQADPDSQKILITIGQPFANHNGGQIAFGPDGYLYIGMGDGGAANDPQNRAQNLKTLLGKILRIDVNSGEPYGAPQNNPFVDNPQARPEIWSYGWRNPWRFSFDLATDEMYIADVGQNQYEYLHYEAPNSPGQNYGWRLMEGNHCFNPSQCDPADLGLVLPIAEYEHSQGCSITGGYVYRGDAFPALSGIYFYADYCSGIMWGTQRHSNGDWVTVQLLQSGRTISSFGQDQDGEIYILDHRSGAVFQLSHQ